MIRKLFLIVPLAVVLCGFASGDGAAVTPSEAIGIERVAPAGAAVRLAQATVKKKETAGRPAQVRPLSTATPKCPNGQQWNDAAKMCVPAPGATPMPLPGMR